LAAQIACIKIMKTVDQISFAGKKALIRSTLMYHWDKDYNITDDNRMTAALPTIDKILKDGGAVILMSHLGRPKGGPEEKYSLKHLVPHYLICWVKRWNLLMTVLDQMQ